MNYFIYNNKNKNQFLRKINTDTPPTNFSSTTVEYPQTSTGYTRCFNTETNSWSDEIKDYRGIKIYYIYNSLNNYICNSVDLPEGYSDITPPNSVISYQLNIKNNQWQLINAASDFESTPNNVTKFQVYANAEVIPAGSSIPELSKNYTTSVEIPVGMTHEFSLDIFGNLIQSDVMIDWGDGNITKVCEETSKTFNHTYIKTGKYLITIAGEKYNRIKSTSSDKNLICRIFEYDLPTTAKLRKASSLCAGALRLIELDCTYNDTFKKLINFPYLFLNCQNLKKAVGFPDLTYVQSVNGIFSSCHNLITTDFKLPEFSDDYSAVFAACYELTTPIDKLLPTAGFAPNTINLTDTFTGLANSSISNIDKLNNKLFKNKNLKFVGTLSQYFETEYAGPGGKIMKTNSSILDKIKNEEIKIQNITDDQFVAHKVAVCGNNYEYTLSNVYQKNTFSTKFIEVPFFNNVKQISITKTNQTSWPEFSGYNSFILSNNGLLYVTGHNGTNILGKDKIYQRNSDYSYNYNIINRNLNTTFKSVSLGGSIVGALDHNNKLYIWGRIEAYNYSYDIQLASPQLYFSDKTWKEIYTGGTYMAGIDINDDLYLWFNNYGGQIGNGEYYDFVTEPYLLDETKKWKKAILPFGMQGSYYYDRATTHAIDLNGHLYGWGANIYGQLGTGTISNGSSENFQPLPILIDDTHIWIDGSAGDGFIVLIDSNGHLYGCGNNSYGQLGLGDTTDRTTITLIDNTHCWKKVICGGTHILLIDSNGHLYGCGNNNYGQLGLGDTTNRTNITLIDNTKIYTDAACSMFASMVIYEQIIQKNTLLIQKYPAEQPEIEVGTIIISAQRQSWSSKSGYLLCNGGAVSRTTYKRLFDAIGTTYGAGDGSTTFNLPNLIDKFIMGGNTAGAVKAAGLPNITGGFTTRVPGNHVNYAVGAFNGSHATNTSNTTTAASYAGSGTSTWQDTNRYGFVLNASKSSSIYGASTTVQPPSVTMCFYIKY